MSDDAHLDLGAFSLSLTVRDLAVSTAFYEQLGFEAFGGDTDAGWRMLRSGSTVIGLFQGMFDRNILTFTPGWSADGPTEGAFTDVRDLQRSLRERGVEVVDVADETGDGPASFTVVDPDGNPILVDQHVPRPDPGV
ncbi:VOC family protein [Microbacterium aquimaris]|uniref:VOC family protein n=1 Tax=Microbacterium aquimaris TaxID=459816 RepID=A0ABU5N5J8_9MICO|nr:VOC family protein [Microbacterium aquimaris]MDZ8161384.1 VOC family protein [Microbacterium aquimaris]